MPKITVTLTTDNSEPLKVQVGEENGVLFFRIPITNLSYLIDIQDATLEFADEHNLDRRERIRRQMLSPEALSNLMEAEGMTIEIGPVDRVGDAPDDGKFVAYMMSGSQVIHRAWGASPAESLYNLQSRCPYPAGELADFLSEGGSLEELDAWLEERWMSKEEEDEELVPPPGYGYRVFPPDFSEQRRIRGVDHGAERAEPSAKEAAQHDREERDDQRGPDQPDERPPREGGGPRHQGIEPEKQVDRVRKDVVVLVLRVQEEEGEEKEHHPLRGAPKRPRRLHPGTPGVITFRSDMLLLYQRYKFMV